MDLGSGALANLLEHVRPDGLGGLALTHMHYDHYVDIYGLCTARRFWEKEVDPLPLLAPPHASEVITSPLQAGSREEFMRSLDLRGVRPGVPQGIAGFDIVALPAAHGAIDSLIYRISRDGKVVCYSGDTDLCAALVEQARGADLFICEATFTSQVRNRMQGHLFAAEAGEALGRYREAVGGAKGTRTLRGVGAEGFAAADSFYGTIVAARRDRHVAVALGASTEDAGRKQVADVLRCAR